MKARYLVTKDLNKTTQTEQGEVELDVKDIAPAPGEHGAEVEMQTGFARSYGEIKVSALVLVRCAQGHDAILKAGRAAHLLAYELAQDGFNMVCSDFDAGAKG